ncbi:MAG: hypothetical protein C7B47_15080 [Sulfobacillus thermosulfidooxidans]|uniref:Uncharacterized protein n=1 Tax=Sulfobacillus thermosulfidooxidans TaxID=28034 RepID=A0A2T2WQ04_SULTH|nr:MAG: hypothetical protein C7B47_15080 [Sulfobacillus thermosulfidooxidans]
MLPTSPGSGSSSPHRPPPRRDDRFVYRGGLLLRGLTGVFLFWIAAQYPAVVWPQAASVLEVNAVAAVWWLERPQEREDRDAVYLGLNL